MANPLPDNPAVIFGSAIEGFARTYRDRLVPSVRDEMAALGINLDDILPAYSLDVFERAMRRAGEAIYPDLPLSERWRRMGREFVEGYVQTMMGTAVMAMARVLGPRRTLERVVRTFRTGSNYLGAETTGLGPTEVEIRTWMLEPYLPQWRGKDLLHLDYRHGILEGMLARLGVREAAVTIVEKDLQTQSARYRVRWSE